MKFVIIAIVFAATLAVATAQGFGGNGGFSISLSECFDTT